MYVKKFKWQRWWTSTFCCKRPSIFNTRFPVRRIGRLRSLEWPPRSPDLSPLDFSMETVEIERDCNKPWLTIYEKEFCGYLFFNPPTYWNSYFSQKNWTFETFALCCFRWKWDHNKINRIEWTSLHLKQQSFTQHCDMNGKLTCGHGQTFYYRWTTCQEEINYNIIC